MKFTYVTIDALDLRKLLNGKVEQLNLRADDTHNERVIVSVKNRKKLDPLTEEE